MNILIIDGQGGGIGSQLVIAIKEQLAEAVITAVGTNTAATTAMIKAGAHQAATGENPVIVGCKKSDVIIGPIGIVVADALFGEITPKMAAAVGQSSAKRILIPTNNSCDNIIAGISDLPMGKLVQNVVSIIKNLT